MTVSQTVGQTRGRGAAAASKSAVEAAQNRLDAWVREVVEWHFHPETGSPFWTERAKGLGWDPRKEVRGFEDLARFGPFLDEWLRGGDPRRWVPRAYADRPVYVFETGGSGSVHDPARSVHDPARVPKHRINIEDFRIDYAMFSETLSDESFPKGSDWLAIGPTGPRRLRLAVEHLAQIRGGICFGLDLDPRWVIQSIRRGNVEGAEAYKDHVIDQALTILRSQPNVRCLFTTPKLLEALCAKVSLGKSRITGVLCGGTHMTAEFHRLAREDLLEGADFVPTYGNTLMGLACHKPFVPEDDFSITYHAPQPRAVLQVVDPDEPRRVVGHGEKGRVKLTTLTKELFLPGFLERDEAIRTKPIEIYPWDGVRDVRPFTRFGATVVEGVH